MAATITSTSERITISGTYKAFTGGSGNTTTVIQFSSGDAPATGDAGRFLLWQNTADTGAWEVRFIESATSTTVTVTDGGFSSAPGAGEDFVISSNLDDINSATAGSVMRSQGNSYQMRDRDFELASGAFLADVNASLSTKSTQTGSGFISTYPVANGCVLQFGRLVGGEANDSTETIGGCQIIFEVVNNTLMFTSQNAENTAGPVLNFYGCLIESIANSFSPFIRAPGAMRIIGCVADGPMGGRLYNSASELVDTRFSGNLSGGIAWSLGGSFTRPISNAFFFQGNTAVKAFGDFSGTFSDTTFASSLTNIIDAGSASSGLLFSFIDCTTFADGDITANNGQYEQLKSINYTVTDASGTGLSGVKVAVYDTVGDVQGGGVQTSASGAVSQINARFFRKDHGATAVSKSPFDIRIRKYGYTYLGFQSSVAEPVKQEVRLAVNSLLVSTEVQAAAITGISLNFATSTATITSNHDTQNLYDYYQYQLTQTSNMVYGEDLTRAGSSFDMADWDVVVDGCTYTGDMTTTGTITLANGAVFNGERTDSSGTILAPRNISVTGIVAGSRLRIYNTTTSTEVYNAIVSGTSYTATYAEGTGYSENDVLEVRVSEISKLEFSSSVVASATGWSLLVSQETNSTYASYGVDGSTVTGITWDSGNMEFDFNDPDNTLQGGDIAAWYFYFITTSTGISEAFGAISWPQINRISNRTATRAITFDNTKADALKITGAWVDRDDGTTIIASGSNSIQIDPPAVFVKETGTSGLTPAESAKLDLISTVDGKVDTIDTVVDTISADVTTIETKVDAVDAVVDSTSATVTSIDTKVDTIDTVVDSVKLNTGLIPALL
jgi:hypothetical protein